MASNPLKLPPGQYTVEIAIIDTTTYLGNVPANVCMDPVYPGCERFCGPSYSFLVTHPPTNIRILYDLGLRKDWETKSSPLLIERLKPHNLDVKVEKNTSEILQAEGIEPGCISAIIWSHHHWDHTGDPSTFPAAKLIVGPGFKKKYMPGWPEDPKAAETTSDCFANREVIELDFSESAAEVCSLGGFRTFDYFGDGSFYILDTPGHTTGHISALARTSKSREEDDDSTFIFLGGDISHHCALFRPTEFVPLPKEIIPSPYSTPFTSTSISCPGEIFASLHHLRNGSDGINDSYTRPFSQVSKDEFPEESQRSVNKLTSFDGLENVLTIFAHDENLVGVVDFFPKSANDWKKKGWGRESHWRFLAAFLPSEKYEAIKSAS